MPPVGYLETGVIYCDDNLARLAVLPAESVDLIYLDPPFFSNRHYEVIWGDEAEVRSFEDRWEGGVQVYVAWMRERVLEMHRVLKPTGSFYLHCDWHASHYLKAMLDDVFGQSNFRNEIVWSYRRWTASKRQLPRLHDVILFYTKTNEYFFEVPTRLNDDPNPSQYVSAKDASGKTIVATDEAGNPIKREVAKRIQVGDVWEIGLMSPVSKERLGYPTQKPTSLLTRIVQMSSQRGDTVLDPFAGCGTALVAAQQEGRKWVGIDISPTAVNVMKRRMEKVGARDIVLVNMPTTEAQLRELKPFEFQNWVIQRFNGTYAPRKSRDMGIDGRSFFHHYPIQVKQSEHVGRNVVDNFETAVQRDGRQKGYIVAFSFTRDAHEEAARAKVQGKTDIELVTVADLLAGGTPDLSTGELVPDLPLPKAREADARPSVEELVESESSKDK